ncbi:dTDP-glucose 4,6-dehydratase [Sulfolobus acidocaldarius]|uniref:NAD-dependent epimerase/dehydratase protein n=4 Tax=Sulfolobus acidocaldarius TaxID=2285 RepID=Q4J870_SULAC|nr:dTDP-glucose 4,6-dehydratase [Sulfolobus acidocaldarius]AAY81010.1 NAD-dependent epimerase/dehydratase protein [Sulfolobus acidocaldarius DSM 639]AGE71615.1 NAD-dependent epimerase/dehydratase protein [Sulfolobus acidocaldarius N8]AGE73888.1 NAD-dependent epimerase/dehydratase protein [Sulfolobus acidocaldarius Ron12/I]ALU30165.1 dTDP-glucose 4,6-dehydratase [Sulfolobus acidocaldarius]ALU30860.1 dTDP-glucose 4,6-dehydratase [Sulfolobus acidocaldarius]
MVTGGAGFIGSSFSREVKKPVIFDLLTYAGRLENLIGVDHIFVKGDIRNYSQLEDTVKKYDIKIIVNFSAETHVDRSINNAHIFLDTNVYGVVNLLEICRRYDTRLVQISTDEVYGEQENATEDFPLRPSSPYSASKASADMFILAYVRTYGVDAIIIRPSNNYGPRQHIEKLIPKTIVRTLLGLEIPIYGKGDQERDWIYVEDTAKVIAQLVETGKKGEIYNVPGGQRTTNIKLVEMIGELMGREPKIKFVKDRPGHDKKYSMVSTKLSYKVTPLKEGLSKTIKWYLENEWWWRPLLNDEYFLRETSW